ncbi:hypothetical protein HYW32_03465 [Candidatus Berkelbacteria bacterium]|nr:hypothetical protein [Candidatus Berkelbacteria bacterium]
MIPPVELHKPEHSPNQENQGGVEPRAGQQLEQYQALDEWQTTSPGDTISPVEPFDNDQSSPEEKTSSNSDLGGAEKSPIPVITSLPNGALNGSSLESRVGINLIQ